MTTQTSNRSGRAAVDCAECGAELRGGAKFCATCGARTDGRADPAEPAPPAIPDRFAQEPPAPAQPAPAPPVAAPPAAPARPATGPVPAPGESFLLPSIPTKIFWSPRKEWTVTTSLPDSQIAEIFTDVMTRKPSILRRANNYFRRARWDVTHRSTAGELVATCVPDGLVEVGVGRHKRLVDVSGDTVALRVSRSESHQKADVSVGVGKYTRWWWLYLFPATVYTYDVVKSLKRADRAAQVRYPWSPFRMILVAALAIALIASAASGGGGSSGSYGNSTPGGSSSYAGPAQNGDPPPPQSAPSRGPSSSEGSSSSAPAGGPIPDRPTTSDPAQMAAELNRAQQVVDDSTSSASDVESAGRLEQLSTRALQLDPSLRGEVYPQLDPGASSTIRATVASAQDLAVSVAPQKKLPHWRISAPLPARKLLAYYRDAESASGVPWQYLAAINFVETRMGRISGDSPAGAEGPMQFLPETWARYGSGDIHNTHDSILAAARLLTANGAPADMHAALYHYNPANGYTRAIERYVRLIQADDRAFYTLYSWQVLYKTVRGTYILPVGYPDVRPEPAG